MENLLGRRAVSPARYSTTVFLEFTPPCHSFCRYGYTYSYSHSQSLTMVQLCQSLFYSPISTFWELQSYLVTAGQNRTPLALSHNITTTLSTAAFLISSQLSTPPRVKPLSTSSDLQPRSFSFMLTASVRASHGLPQPFGTSTCAGTPKRPAAACRHKP